MQQLMSNKGKITTKQVPIPLVSNGYVLIKTIYSCISTGSESAQLAASDPNLIRRALEQPEKVKKVFDFYRSNGLKDTWNKVKDKVDAHEVIGYSLSGIVIQCGKGVTRFRKGDKVAAAGKGQANHAEYVEVPENLVMRIPENLDLKKAATVTMGGIALQGVRRLNLTLGESAVVFGAGALGLLSQQLLQAAGIRVHVIEPDENRRKIALDCGAISAINPFEVEPIHIVHQLTDGYGADGVLFTAATASSVPLSQAFRMCRKKGKVVLVGVSGMELNRDDIYEKELDFLISTSYGPGRYDENYEEKGLDYPISYVRWTENRNLSEYLKLLATQKINITPLLEDIFPLEDAELAFKQLEAEVKPLLVLLDYGFGTNQQNDRATTKIRIKQEQKRSGTIQTALIGPGGFARAVHLPNLQKLHTQFQLKAMVARKGSSVVDPAEKFRCEYISSNPDDLFSDGNLELVIICTRHDSHRDLTIRALEAGKNVLVEKPLATTPEELESIRSFYQRTTGPKPLLLVGFNRRFSPHAQAIYNVTQKRINPLLIRYRMNAGHQPHDHWTHASGGRIIGEACHIIDLCNYLTGCAIQNVSCSRMIPKTDYYKADDNCTITLEYVDGSLASIDYFATGSPSLAKEYMEVHYDGKSIIMRDYRQLSGHGVTIPNLANLQFSQPEKGHLEELQSIADVLRGSKTKWPIQLEDMLATTEATFIAAGIL